MRIGICDDEPVICANLERYILDFQTRTTEKLEVEVFYDGLKFSEWIKKSPAYDLLFLDIELDSISGIDISRQIRNEMGNNITKIVYITSTSGYERQLFDFQPIYFLPKPFEREKVFACISLTLKLLERECKTFSFKVEHDVIRIPIREILYFESMGRKLKLACVKEYYEFYEKIDNVAEKLSTCRFIRPHRICLINYDQTIKIGQNEIIMSNGKHFYVSRRRIKEIKALQVKFEEDKIWS